MSLQVLIFLGDKNGSENDDKTEIKTEMNLQQLQKQQFSQQNQKIANISQLENQHFTNFIGQEESKKAVKKYQMNKINQQQLSIEQEDFCSDKENNPQFVNKNQQLNDQNSDNDNKQNNNKKSIYIQSIDSNSYFNQGQIQNQKQNLNKDNTSNQAYNSQFSYIQHDDSIQLSADNQLNKKQNNFGPAQLIQQQQEIIQKNLERSRNTQVYSKNSVNHSQSLKDQNLLNQSSFNEEQKIKNHLDSIRQYTPHSNSKLNNQTKQNYLTQNNSNLNHNGYQNLTKLLRYRQNSGGKCQDSIKKMEQKFYQQSLKKFDENQLLITQKKISPKKQISEQKESTHESSIKISQMIDNIASNFQKVQLFKNSQQKNQSIQQVNTHKKNLLDEQIQGQDNPQKTFQQKEKQNENLIKNEEQQVHACSIQRFNPFSGQKMLDDNNQQTQIKLSRKNSQKNYEFNEQKENQQNQNMQSNQVSSSLISQIDQFEDYHSQNEQEQYQSSNCQIQTDNDQYYNEEQNQNFHKQQSNKNFQPGFNEQQIQYQNNLLTQEQCNDTEQQQQQQFQQVENQMELVDYNFNSEQSYRGQDLNQNLQKNQQNMSNFYEHQTLKNDNQQYLKQQLFNQYDTIQGHDQQQIKNCSSQFDQLQQQQYDTVKYQQYNKNENCKQSKLPEFLIKNQFESKKFNLQNQTLLEAQQYILQNKKLNEQLMISNKNFQKSQQKIGKLEQENKSLKDKLKSKETQLKNITSKNQQRLQFRDDSYKDLSYKQKIEHQSSNYINEQNQQVVQEIQCIKMYKQMLLTLNEFYKKNDMGQMKEILEILQSDDNNLVQIVQNYQIMYHSLLSKYQLLVNSNEQSLQNLKNEQIKEFGQENFENSNQNILIDQIHTQTESSVLIEENRDENQSNNSNCEDGYSPSRKLKFTEVSVSKDPQIQSYDQNFSQAIFLQNDKQIQPNENSYNNQFKKDCINLNQHQYLENINSQDVPYKNYIYNTQKNDGQIQNEYFSEQQKIQQYSKQLDLTDLKNENDKYENNQQNLKNLKYQDILKQKNQYKFISSNSKNINNEKINRLNKRSNSLTLSSNSLSQSQNYLKNTLQDYSNTAILQNDQNIQDNQYKNMNKNGNKLNTIINSEHEESDVLITDLDYEQQEIFQNEKRIENQEEQQQLQSNQQIENSQKKNLKKKILNQIQLNNKSKTQHQQIQLQLEQHHQNDMILKSLIRDQYDFQNYDKKISKALNLTSKNSSQTMKNILFNNTIFESSQKQRQKQIINQKSSGKNFVRNNSLNFDCNNKNNKLSYSQIHEKSKSQKKNYKNKQRNQSCNLNSSVKPQNLTYNLESCKQQSKVQANQIYFSHTIDNDSLENLLCNTTQNQGLKQINLNKNQIQIPFDDKNQIKQRYEMFENIRQQQIHTVYKNQQQRSAKSVQGRFIKKY
ncbi:hypothetical protein PPERSA_06338 [Pseudocohnilembus persalinus]|uniref:Uncharacterized protein n=1 Tax=Pseudocohnilembus persalinus TaxID=266149 RepID=A0A0V0QIL5_PSEPJ|nr:hypothetical protein PPERSA_06338 [Pseudocohnilembus persalinus]|eukprot:KRX02143.1 hypothetical protein PPERSA_06338 [Pseudocohnilembus persalinus]